LRKKEASVMKISARNVLKGKVKTVNHGAVNSEVTVEVAGGVQVVSIITKTSAENLKLAPGKDVYAIIKASNVMIGIDYIDSPVRKMIYFPLGW
jgi:molybdopterin-binding protein